MRLGRSILRCFPARQFDLRKCLLGADLVSHTAVFISHTQGTGVNTQSGTDEPDAGHTHGVTNVNLGLADIRPPFKNLKFIRAATTTLPSGVIGMFDVPSSSLPSGWTYYSAMENQYCAEKTRPRPAGRQLILISSPHPQPPRHQIPRVSGPMETCRSCSGPHARYFRQHARCCEQPAIHRRGVRQACGDKYDAYRDHRHVRCLAAYGLGPSF